MPITPQTPYPTVEQVANRLRAYVNDTFNDGAGRLLTDTNPVTVQIINGALEELEDKIGNNQVITLTVDNYIATPILPVQQQNPQTQVTLAYTGYFDGTVWWPTPVLPGDCISVEKVWEMQTGSNVGFQEMRQCQEGLPSCLQGPWLNLWEYRQDSIYMPGSTITEDLRLRYTTRFLPIAPPSPTNVWSDITINILASVNSLATVAGYLYARGRGGQAAATMVADGLRMMNYITNRYIRRAQHISYGRQSYGDSSSGDGHTAPSGGGWPVF
jgi:hypothetical protein